MAAVQRALDVSNYSGSLSLETVACWREQGYEHLVCGTQRRETTRQQLETAFAGGMTVDAYVYLYWRHPIAEQVQAALRTVEGLPVGRLWLDCEDSAEGRSAGELVALIAEAIAACGDFPHGIYSGRWWWQPNTGNSDAFAHLPLWHAEYTAGPGVLPDFERFQPYGGWTRPAIWQFQGTTYLCGVGVDLNLRDLERASPAAPPVLDEADRHELNILRAERRFLRAFSSGRYAFEPVSGRTDVVELRWLHEGVSHSFEPPCHIEVD